MLYHNSHWSFYRYPFGAIPTGERLALRLVVKSELKPQDVFLRIWHKDHEKIIPMSRVMFLEDLDQLNGHFKMGGGDSDIERFYAFPNHDREIHLNLRNFIDDRKKMEQEKDADMIDPFTGQYSEKSPKHQNGYIVYQATCIADIEPCLLWYYFIVHAGDKVCYYGNNFNVMGGAGVMMETAPQSYQITVYDRAFKTPSWFKQGVMYQIFPDRFYQKRERALTQGDLEKIRPDYIYHENWNEEPIYKPDPRSGHIMNHDFFGGNIEGIIEKLPYLKELGINILYLNPIFEAYSNHRYDTGNYMKIDMLLGDNEDFRHLCEEAGKLGIRVLLDGVFNHTGSDSIYFNKQGYYEEIGAFQSRESKFFNWYEFQYFPDVYTSWWGIDTLPSVRESEKDYVDYILADEDSVVRYWLKLGASGWRLDVVDELPGTFVKTLRQRVKSLNPEAVIIGEVWEDASNKVSYGEQREYLLGDELDSVMNYVFKDAVIGFMLGHLTAEGFHAKIYQIYENYPKESFYALMNLVGGHDVVRIRTLLSDPPGDLSKDQRAAYQPSVANLDIATKRLKLVSLIQMTFPGVPSVYYGDEVGLTGFDDPFNRRTFPWDSMDEELLAWYKQLIALRNAFEPLRTGAFAPIYCNAEVYAYTRSIQKKVDVFGNAATNGFALIAINNSLQESKTLALDLSNWNLPELVDPFQMTMHRLDKGKVQFTLAPLGYQVLVYPKLEKK